MCCCTWDSCLNLLSQYEHLYGFSPVCTLQNNFAIKIILIIAGHYCKTARYLSTFHSPYMLDKLMVAWERFETLLALMGLYLGSSSDSFSSQLHGCLRHQILNKKTFYFRLQRISLYLMILVLATILLLLARKMVSRNLCILLHFLRQQQPASHAMHPRDWPRTKHVLQ